MQKVGLKLDYEAKLFECKLNSIPMNSICKLEKKVNLINDNDT